MAYVQRGWWPVPIPAGSKGPMLEGWPKLRVEEERIAELFGSPGNIGIILGDPSGDLTDIDLDCPEAVRAAGVLLPPTPMVHGRPSAPASHRWYIARGANTRVFDHPECARDARLVEIRSTGSQTMVPPSKHPETGEEVQWEGALEPASVDAADLERAVAKVAAAALISRCWQREGRQRHLLSLALAGALFSSGVRLGEAEQFVQAVCEAARDEETRDRLEAVRDTYEKRKAGQPTTGWPRLTEIIGGKRAQRVSDWLDLAEQSGGDDHTTQDTRAGGRPRIWSYGDMEAEEFPAVEWAAEGMFPRKGLVLVHGPAESGKSLISADLAIAAASGRLWLEKIAVCRCAVLYWDEEMGIERTFVRFQRLGARAEDPLYYLDQPGLRLTSPDDVGWVLAECASRGIGLIIIDTVIAVNELDEREAVEIRQLRSVFRRFAVAGITVVAIIHNRKGFAGASGLLEIAGSREYGAMADAAWEIKRVDRNSDDFLLECSKLRDGSRADTDKYFVTVVDHDGRLRVAAGLTDASVHRDARYRRLVLTVLQNAWGRSVETWLTREELQNEGECSRDCVVSGIKQLTSEELLHVRKRQKEGRGSKPDEYRLTDEAVETQDPDYYGSLN
jgi:hypothetical protein